MNRFKTCMLVAAMLLSIAGVMFAAVENGGAGDVFAPATLYVGPSDSTYPDINAALLDAQDGDTIVVAPGTYNEQLWIQTDNLTISGNYSAGEIMVYEDNGPACFLDAVTNVTLRGINFTSENSQGIRIDGCNNISLQICVMWSIDGVAGALGIKDSENVMFNGSFFGGLLVVHSEGDGNPAIKIDNSRYVTGYLLDVSTSGIGSHAVETYGSCPYIGFSFSSFETKLAASSIFYIRGDSDGYVIGIAHDYTGDLIHMNQGHFNFDGVEVTDDGVDISGSASIDVFMSRDIEILDEDDNPVEDVDMVIWNDIDGDVYATEVMGGSDDKTDVLGMVYSVGFYTKYYQGSNIPVYAENFISVQYNGGDFPVMLFNQPIDANTTDTLTINLPDFWLPVDAYNVTATTISHTRVDLNFEPSPSSDVDHYEVWTNSSDEWIWDFNTTEAGQFNYTDLMPATKYGYRVIAVDINGYKSAGIDVYNTTLPPIEGKIDGSVIYKEGPMNGTNATNATIYLIDTDGEETMNRTIEEDGLFDLGQILFADNYTLKVMPEDVVVLDGDTSGYLAWEWNFDHTVPITKDIELEYYLYVPPPPITNGTLEGMISYYGGAKPGMNSTNATVSVMNETGVLLASMVVNETGLYKFEELDFGVNYTLKVIPADGVDIGGTVSGYFANETLFNFSADSVMDMMLEYYTYTPPPPTSGPISGTVDLKGGPRAGEGVDGATVSLLTSTDHYLANTTTNETGHFVFADVEFENNLTIMVTPPESLLGVVDDKDGYVPEIYTFDHTSAAGTMVPLELSFYDYQEPVVHPELAIRDADGNPVEGVEITMTSGENTYTATTNSSGIAVFDEITGADFPAGSEFEAVKDGYEDISWSLGDTIPELEEEDKEKETDWTLVIIIVIIVALIVLALLFIAFRGKTDEDLYEE